MTIADWINLSMLIITICLFLVAWWPQVHQHYLKPKLYGKLINHTKNRTKIEARSYNMYFLRYKMVSQDKSMLIKHYDAYIKYPGVGELKMKKIWLKDSIWVMEDEQQLMLDIPQKQNLGYEVLLKKDEPADCFITVLDEYDDRFFDEVRLEITDSKERRYSITAHKEDLNESTIFFDKTIWKSPTTDERRSIEGQARKVTL